MWNWISARWAVWVGLLVPTNSLLPRLNSGSTLCFCTSSSLTSFIALCVGSKAVASITGMPNSTELAAAIAPALTSFFSASHCASGTLASPALVMASRAAVSSRAPSCTSRRAMPVIPTRLTFGVATAFIDQDSPPVRPER